MSLVYYERWLGGRARRQSLGPGAMASGELTRTRAGVGVAHKSGRKDLMYWGVLLGLAAGFLTDMVVTAAGA